MKDKNFNEILRCRIIKPNGEIRWIESHHSRSKFMSKNCIITVQLDITERHNKIELRKLFEYSINLIQNAFFIIDINANKFLHVNEVVKNIYGYTSDILIEKGLDFWINKCIHTIDKNKILSAYNNNKILPNKYSIISSDGEIKLLESKSFYQHYSGKNCLIIIARDITNYN
ncbi:MAG: PAS domain S-box protein [bacterium]|nr:PAS domain S-box protein [bacterium]